VENVEEVVEAPTGPLLVARGAALGFATGATLVGRGAMTLGLVPATPLLAMTLKRLSN